MSNPFTTIEPTDLETVRGGEGGWGQTFSDAYTGVQNAGGGFAAGATFGANARTDNVRQYADPSSQATKFGFETGAMFNMALGPFGRMMSTAAGGVPSGGGGGQ